MQRACNKDWHTFVDTNWTPIVSIDSENLNTELQIYLIWFTNKELVMYCHFWTQSKTTKIDFYDFSEMQKVSNYLPFLSIKHSKFCVIGQVGNALLVCICILLCKILPRASITIMKNTLRLGLENKQTRHLRPLILIIKIQFDWNTLS